MSMLVAWIVYPAVLAALCGGVGLLVDLALGRRLPGALVLPAGLAAIVVVGEFTTATSGTAQFTVPVVVFGAVLGLGLSLPWRFGRPEPLPVAVAVAVFLVFGAPVILSGQPTFAGYIKLDDTATWLAMTDRIMEHGRSLAGLDPSSYYATLDANLPSGYPIGAFIPFGTAQKLVGGDLAWVFQPYLSFLAAMLSLALWEILAAVRRARLRAAAAFVAAQPALLFGYALWGGVKEITTAVLVALAAAVAPAVLRSVTAESSTSDKATPDAGRRGPSRAAATLLALPAAALVAVLSLGGLVWVTPMLLALAVLASRRFGYRTAARLGLTFAAALVVMALPTLLAGGFNPLQSGLTKESELGNLIAPLSPFQAVGTWPAGDFRTAPSATVANAVMIGLALFAAFAGLWDSWRRRVLAPLLFATALLACAAIVAVGSPWVGGKALATVSPVALTLAVLGALALLRVDRVTGIALAVVVAGGVLWSNVLAYGGVSLAPYDQLAELQRIGSRFAGEGPTLMTEYNPYGARHFLREEDGEGASELRTRTVPLRAGGSAEKGYAVDTDELAPGGLFEFRTLVLRRSPVRSRPPLPYRRVWAGEYYEVWQRPEGETAPPEYLALGDQSQPAAVPECAAVERLGALAAEQDGSGARLIAARHAPVYDATAGSFELPRPGRYVAWVKGSIRGEDELYVDGREFGHARHQLENEGGYVELGEGPLAAGRHTAQLRLGGADLHPGSGGFPRPAVGPLLFAPAGTKAGRLVSVPATAATRLCGREWDWVEIAPRA